MSLNNPTKPMQGVCQSYDRVDKDLVQCDKSGVRRYDNGLDSGIHCDEYWQELVLDCRKRSW